MVWRYLLYLFDTLNSFLFFYSIFSLLLLSIPKVFLSLGGFVLCLSGFFGLWLGFGFFFQKKIYLFITSILTEVWFRSSEAHQFTSSVMTFIFIYICIHIFCVHFLFLRRMRDACLLFLPSYSYTNLLCTAAGPICHRIRIIMLVTTTSNNELQVLQN